MINTASPSAPDIAKATSAHLRNILVPTDLSAASADTIATAKYLAQRFNADVHLANVIDDHYPPEICSPFGGGTSTLETYLADALQSQSRRLKKLAAEQRITGDCLTRRGAPIFHELCSTARELSADLIVTSTHGRTGLPHALLGSTAEQLVRHSSCPVFVSRTKKPAVRTPGRAVSASPMTIDRILVPVDCSDCSLAGLEYAIAFANSLAARLLVLHVVDDHPFTSPDGGDPTDEIVRFRHLARAVVQERLRTFVHKARPGTVKVQTCVAFGAPAAQICRVARTRKIDLIITSTHGYTGWKHVFLGSRAEAVVRYAGCSVLVVPSYPANRAVQPAHEFVAARPEPLRFPPVDLPSRAFERIGQARKTPCPTPEHRLTNKFRASHAK